MPKTDFQIVAAVAARRVIGKDGKLPFHCPDDLKRFKALTSGHVVIMGRKTYESIGHPLSNRRNIVLSKTMPPTEGVEIVRDVQELHDLDYEGKTAFVIGGGEIYRQLLPFTSYMHVSYIKEAVEGGDTYFPWDPWQNEGVIFESDKIEFPEGDSNVRYYHGYKRYVAPPKGEWRPFHFESNQFFDTLETPEDFNKLRAAYPDRDDAWFLSARSENYAENRNHHPAIPRFGIRAEHTGAETLGDLFAEQGMTLPPRHKT